MVTKADVKYYKSTKTGSLGGSISTTEIIHDKSNNLFNTIKVQEAVAGRTEYQCIYIKNNHATETMEDVDIFLRSDNKATVYSTVQWGFEYNPNNFQVGPFRHYNGTSEFDSIADTSALDCTSFTLTAWFNSANTSTASIEWIANKGDDPGGVNGMNYGIGMTTDRKIFGKFWDTSDVEHYVESPGTWNDGLWHFVVLRFSTVDDLLRLYIDDMINHKATQTTNTTPRTNSRAFVIGRYSNGSSQFFKGGIDQVRLWNRTLTQNERIKLFEDDTAPANGKVLVHKNSDSKDGSTMAQEIANVTTAPVGVVWQGVTNGPVGNNPNVGDLVAQQSFPIWIKKIIAPGAPNTEDDFCEFEIRANVPQGGTTGTDDDDPVTPQPNTAFTFVAVGDWGTEDTTDEVVDLIANTIKPKLVLGTGDNAYDERPTKSFFNKIKRIDDNQGSSIRFETAFGNHDNAESEDDQSETDNKNHFGYKNTWNFFTIENVHFVIIDNTEETDFDTGSSQHNAVKADLEKFRPNGKLAQGVDWIVVAFHKPMMGGDSKHAYNDGDFNEYYGDLFNKHRVDLIVTGHNHNWQATKQVRYDPDNPESPDIEDSTSPYVGGEGFVHCVSGTGGHDSGSDLYSVSSHNMLSYKSSSHNGVLKCVLSNNNKTMTCSFVDIDGGTENTFVINR